MDINAAQADHTLLIGRVKPHTDFRSKLESGLSKMEVIGLGKIRGATDMHSRGVPGFQALLAPAARIYESDTNVIGGLAILENAYDETAEIVRELLPAMRMTIIDETLTDEGWRIEATYTSTWYGFIDDFVVRLTPEGSMTRVDVRSKSRVGLSDLGANAKRVRAFMEKLDHSTQ